PPGRFRSLLIGRKGRHGTGGALPRGPRWGRCGAGSQRCRRAGWWPLQAYRVGVDRRTARRGVQRHSRRRPRRCLPRAGRRGEAEGHCDAVTLSGKTAAFVAELTASAASSGLFLVRGRRARLLVPSGVPPPVGGTLDLDGAQGMSRVGAAIVFRASLLGDLAKLALVAVNPN